jgi:hypothetical protein
MVILYNDYLSNKTWETLKKELVSKGLGLRQSYGVWESYQDYQTVETLGEINDIWKMASLYEADIKFAIDDLSHPQLARRIAATIHIREMEDESEPIKTN